MFGQKKRQLYWKMKKIIFNSHFNRTSPIPSFKSTSRNECSCEDNRFHDGTFKRAIWPFLIIGQLFGVLPVAGVKTRPIPELEFKWTNLRTIYALSLTCVFISYTFLIIWETLIVKVEFTSIALLLFYGMNTLGFISFLALASKWPQLMQYWGNAENKLPTFRNERHERRFVIKIRFCSLSILFLALVEHSLAVGSMVHFVIYCQPERNPLMELVKQDIPYLFTYREEIPIWQAILAKYICVTITFVWNYLDVFIVTISIGLSTLFQLFNEELEQAKGKHMGYMYWVHRRQQYGRLCDLVNTVDKKISHIILIAFANNLFFTCKQLFQSLRPLATSYRMVYFWFSLVFLIMRGFVVSFCAARINDESKEPLNILRSVPSDSWDAETKRFFDHLTSDTIALSGMRFFFLTRKLMLAMAGTIVTYELVLFQFQLNYSETASCKI